MMNPTRLKSWLALLAVVAVPACAAEAVDEEEGSTSAEVSRCPSPVDDPDGFRACVQAKASGGAASANANGENGQTSKNGNAGNAGEARSENNGGSIQIGDIDATGCGDLSISCDDSGCTCRGNGGPTRSCNGNDCVAVCCGE